MIHNSKKNGPDSRNPSAVRAFLCLNYAKQSWFSSKNPEPFSNTLCHRNKHFHCSTMDFLSCEADPGSLGCPPLRILQKFTRAPVPVSKKKGSRDLTPPGPVNSSLKPFGENSYRFMLHI